MKGKWKGIRYILLSIAAFWAMASMSGCYDVSFGDQTLLRPPRATGDRADIQTIISQQAGSGYKLKYPQKGSYRAAINVFETGSNEYAAAFYSGETDPTLNLSIIAHVGEEWISLGNFTNPGSGVDRMILKDINKDGMDEILVGWTGYNSSRNTLTAYSLESGTVREMLIEDTYTDIVITDLTDDSSEDIVLLSLRNTQTQTPSSAKLLQYSEQEKRPISKYDIELDSEVTNFTNVVVGKISPDRMGIYIDCEKTGGVLATQLIYYEPVMNTLVNPLVTVNESGAVVNPTTRKYIVNAKDVDNDSYIELPVVSQMPASANENPGSVCMMTSWKQIDITDGGLKTKLNTVINYTDGYYVIMPDEWIGNVTALSDPENRQITFYTWNSKTGMKGEKLLTIYRFTRSVWSKQDSKDYILLNKSSKSGSDAVLAAKLYRTDVWETMNLTEERLVNLIKIIT